MTRPDLHARFLAIALALQETRETLMDFMDHEGFAFMSHQEHACAVLGHTVAAKEYSKRYWGDIQPCYCLQGPVKS